MAAIVIDSIPNCSPTLIRTKLSVLAEDEERRAKNEEEEEGEKVAINTKGS